MAAGRSRLVAALARLGGGWWFRLLLGVVLGFGGAYGDFRVGNGPGHLGALVESQYGGTTKELKTCVFDVTSGFVALSGDYGRELRQLTIHAYIYA